MVQGQINRGRHTDHPAGRHSIRTNQCPPPPSPIFFYGPDALPAAQPTVSKHWRQNSLGWKLTSTTLFLAQSTKTLWTTWQIARETSHHCLLVLCSTRVSGYHGNDLSWYHVHEILWSSNKSEDCGLFDDCLYQKTMTLGHICCSCYRGPVFGRTV